jgi:hypothetical protein
MKRVQLEFISQGFHDLLCSEPVAGEVEAAAEKVAGMATSSATRSKTSDEPARFVVKGPKIGGYGGGRYIAYVSADNSEAAWDAIYNHRLETVIWEAQV